MERDYQFIKIDFPVTTLSRGDMEHLIVKDHGPGAGLHSLDNGLTWFSLGDPFDNRLALLLSRCGDDWTGTLMFAGLPCMVVVGGASMEDGQYDDHMPSYLEPEMQALHAMFFEYIVGSLPTEGEDDTVRGSEWPFPHDAMNMVHLQKADGRHYDLYNDLMPEGGGEGHEWVQMIGVIAHSMYSAAPGDLTEPRGF